MSGCGNPPGSTVYGKVLHKGEPAVERSFTSIARAPAPLRRRFRLASSRMTAVSTSLRRTGERLSPGKYAVLVEWRDDRRRRAPVKTTGKTKLVKRSRVRSGLTGWAAATSTSASLCFMPRSCPSPILCLPSSSVVEPPALGPRVSVSFDGATLIKILPWRCEHGFRPDKHDRERPVSH